VLTGEERLVLPGDLGTPLAFSPDGQILTAALYKARPPEKRGSYRFPSEIEAVGFWELATGQAIGRVKTGPVAQVAFAPGGRLLVSAGTDALCLWDFAAGKEVLRQPIELVNSRVFSSSVVSLAFSPTGRTVATGLADSTILVWDVSAARTAATRRRDLDDKELKRLWTDLAGDAPTAEAAGAALAAASVQAVALIKERVGPATEVPAERLRRLLADLDSPQFTARDAAVRELEKLGDRAEPALRRALEGKPSLEVRRRIESVLSSLRLVRQPELLRGLRAIRVLEQVGTPVARQVLQALADGTPEARLTQEAKASLQRLTRRAVGTP
jgi:hypothetical protein